MHSESAEDNFGSSSSASRKAALLLLLLLLMLMLNESFLLVLGMSKNTSKSIVMMQAQNGSTKFEMDQMVHVILTDLDSVAVFHMMQALQCCCWCAREC